MNENNFVEGMTYWHNPLRVAQKARIYMSPGNWKEFVVPPGEMRALQTDLDPGIQRVNADGVVVSGSCPLLVPVARDGKALDVHPRIHEALDPANAERKTAQERLAQVQLEELLAEKQARIDEMKAKSAAALAEETKAEELKAKSTQQTQQTQGGKRQ